VPVFDSKVKQYELRSMLDFIVDFRIREGFHFEPVKVGPEQSSSVTSLILQLLMIYFLTDTEIRLILPWMPNVKIVYNIVTSAESDNKLFITISILSYYEFLRLFIRQVFVESIFCPFPTFCV